MFYRKKHFSDRLLFSKASIEEIVKQFQEAGFLDVRFLIPNEYKKFKKFKFEAREFIDLNYNFVSQILIAKNENEIIKILFVNNPASKTTFDDTTFPSSNSESTKFSIETNDPVRIIGLIDFVDSLLNSSSTRRPVLASLQNKLFTISAFYLFFMSVLFVNIFDSESDIKFTFFENHTFLLSFLAFVSLLYIFYCSLTPGGLYINKFEHPFISFSKRIFIGDLKDNLIISFILFVGKLLFSGFIVNILWFFFGETLINAVKFLPTIVQ